MLVCIVIFWGCPRVRPWSRLSSTCIFAMKSVLAQGACIKLAPNSVRKEQSHLLQVVREGIEKLGLLRDPSKNFFFFFQKAEKRTCPVWEGDPRPSLLCSHVSSPCSTLWWSRHACAAVGVLVVLLNERNHQVLLQDWRNTSEQA